MTELRLNTYLVVLFIYFAYRTILIVISEYRSDSKIKLLINLTLGLIHVVAIVGTILISYQYIFGKGG